MLYTWHPIGGAPYIKQTDCVLLNGEGQFSLALWFMGVVKAKFEYEYVFSGLNSELN